MEMNLKIEHVPHGIVLRDNNNAVFIKRRDIGEVRNAIRLGEYNMITETFTTIADNDGVIFMDAFSDEVVLIPYSELRRL